MRGFRIPEHELAWLAALLADDGIMIRQQHYPDRAYYHLDMIDLWWEMSVHFGEPRSFPSQERHYLEKFAMVKHARHVRWLVESYYESMTEEEREARPNSRAEAIRRSREAIDGEINRPTG